MSAASKLLKQDEWSAGNGQCPACFGLSPAWFNPPYCRYTPEEIGHQKTCGLAQAMQEGGEDVVYIGEYLPEEHGKWSVGAVVREGFLVSECFLGGEA